MNRRTPLRALLAVTVAAVAAASAPAVLAQAWPNKPITFVVPFPPGGGTDAFARPLSAQLTKQLGRQVVIDNRGGAGGTVGASIAAKAAPDGYTFFIGAVHHAIAPSFYPKLDYDIEKDLVPMTVIARPPQVIVVNPNRVPATDLKSLIEQMRKSPGKMNYGSAGNGTSHHLAGELFKQLSKTFVVHIPYRGAGPALQDLIAGNVDMMFDGLGSAPAASARWRWRRRSAWRPSPICRPPPRPACPATRSPPGTASGRSEARPRRSSIACSMRSPRRWPRRRCAMPGRSTARTSRRCRRRSSRAF